MTEAQKSEIRAKLDSGMTPLETSYALGIAFHLIKDFCWRESLQPRIFFIAKEIRKATYADIYWPPE